MKEYHSIGRNIQYGITAYVFNKLDGSNIRAEWTKKNKFNKFGSRHRLLGTDQGVLNESVELIKNGFEKEMSDIFIKERIIEATCFFEFYGKNSFAGNHIDEEHNVSLIDISVYKKGILLPKDFVKLFGNLNIAELLYHGNINQEIVEKVKNSQLEGMGEEGVVCKSLPLKNGYPPNMFKIKTNYWLDKLKTYCNGNEELFQRLM